MYLWSNLKTAFKVWYWQGKLFPLKIVAKWLDLTFFEIQVSLELSRRNRGYMFKEVSLNPMESTDLFPQKLLTSLFSLSSMNKKLSLLSKTRFFYGRLSRFIDISALDLTNFKIQDLRQKEGELWFISFDGLCNYLYLFRRQPTASFLKITIAALLNLEPLVMTPTYLLKQDLAFSLNTV